VGKGLGRAREIHFSENYTSVNAEENKKAYMFISHNMQNKIII
jgi:hypothetical protein